MLSGHLRGGRLTMRTDLAVRGVGSSIISLRIERAGEARLSVRLCVTCWCWCWFSTGVLAWRENSRRIGHV